MHRLPKISRFLLFAFLLSWILSWVELDKKVISPRSWTPAAPFSCHRGRKPSTQTRGKQSRASSVQSAQCGKQCQCSGDVQRHVYAEDKKKKKQQGRGLLLSYPKLPQLCDPPVSWMPQIFLSFVPSLCFAFGNVSWGLSGQRPRRTKSQLGSSGP